MKPIFTSLSPNIEKDDIVLALKMIFQPWKWKKGRAVNVLEEKFKQELGLNFTFAFISGRTALLAILQSSGMEQGSEVLLQAFTCNAVVNPIFRAGFKPIFVDIKKETLNLDPDDLEKKITSRSKAVIVQHTFGLAADLNRISEICRKRNLILIEDCAHSLGAEYQAGKLGSFGKASFFSLGRDKVISSVFGGIAMTNDSELGRKISDFQQGLNRPSCCWIFQQLVHTIIIKFKIMPLYRFFSIGRYCLIFLQKIRILSKAVSKQEKRGRFNPSLIKKMPNGLALLAHNQLSKLKKFNSHRREIAEIYHRELQGVNAFLPFDQQGRIYWRFPVIFNSRNTDFILKKMRSRKIFLNDGWRKTPIMPPDTNQAKMGYLTGSCPTAEQTSQQILNLPTHINISPNQAFKIAGYLKQILKKA